MSQAPARPRQSPSRQDGVVLFIALIALVAMTLAAIGMMRSMDTTTLIAGNISFKQASITSTDQAVQQAYQWLLSKSGSASLDNDDTTNGYSASVPSIQPNYGDPTTWTNAVSAGTDASGNAVSFMINRFCICSGASYNGTCPTGQANICKLYFPSTPNNTGGSMAAGSFTFTGNPELYYSIVVRSQGPKGAASVIQSIVMIST